MLKLVLCSELVTTGYVLLPARREFMNEVRAPCNGSAALVKETESLCTSGWVLLVCKGNVD